MHFRRLIPPSKLHIHLKVTSFIHVCQSTICPSFLRLVCYIPRPSYPIPSYAVFSIPPLTLSRPPLKLPTAIDSAQFQARTVRGPTELQPPPNSKYFPKDAFCKQSDFRLLGVLPFGRKQSVKSSSNKDIGIMANKMEI